MSDFYPFIQNLCYSNVNSSSSCSVGLTTNLTGSTINNFATQLASLLDTGQNSTLGSGGTHFENALKTMNKNVIPNPAGTGTSSSPLPYLFIRCHGSQDYQTQWNGSWGSQNWSSTGAVPYQNSATVIPPNTVTSTDYCTKLKNRGVTIAILYIPYQTIIICKRELRQQRRRVCKQQYREHRAGVTELRLDELLLHREFSDRHSERADRDVPAGRQHRARFQLGLRRS